MPLSPPVERQLIHTRAVTVEGFQRLDGLWDIEAHLTDIKTYSWPNHDRGMIHAGEPLHEMRVRVTMDDDFLIHAVEAVTDHAPFRLCPEITPVFRRLEGLRIGPGFLKQVKTMFAGTAGCTHIVELMGPIATTAFQTLVGQRYQKARVERTGKRPPMIDTCHALAADGEVVAREWPEWAETPKGA